MKLFKLYKKHATFKIALGNTLVVGYIASVL
jgi:hypothetical protein